MRYILSTKDRSGPLPSEFFLDNDLTIKEGRGPFYNYKWLSPEGFKGTFFRDTDAYNYLIKWNFEHLNEREEERAGEVGIEVASHNRTTYSCDDKRQMYDSNGSTLALEQKRVGTLRPSQRWGIEETVKAVYLVDTTTGLLHIAIVPGKRTEQIIQIRSFAHGYAQFANRKGNLDLEIRLYDSKKPLFGIGVEGCYSPFPPSHYFKNGQKRETINEIAAIYIDQGLVENFRKGEKLVQLEEPLKRVASIETARKITHRLNGIMRQLALEQIAANEYRADIYGATEGIEIGKLPFDTGQLGREHDLNNGFVNLHIHAVPKKLGMADLSISPSVIRFPDGRFLEQRIKREFVEGSKHVAGLMQIIDGQVVPVCIKEEAGLYRADIFGPIISGDYREATTTPSEEDKVVILKHHVLPNHRLSVLMPPQYIQSILETEFPGKVHVIPIDIRERKK